MAAISLLLFALLQESQSSPDAQAQTDRSATPVATVAFAGHDLPPMPERKAPQYPKLASMLSQIAQEAESGLFTARAAAAKASASRHDRVGVTFHTDPGHTSAVREFLVENGAEVGPGGEDYVSAWVPVSVLGEASELPGVRLVLPIVPAVPAQGSIGGEGVIAHKATSWHQKGFKGKGVKIGILDVGFEGFGSLSGREVPSKCSRPVFFRAWHLRGRSGCLRERSESWHRRYRGSV